MCVELIRYNQISKQSLISSINKTDLIFSNPIKLLLNIDICLGITLLPRLIWWPFRSIFIHTTIKSYFRASSIELYFLQCICENILRCFSLYLQIFARMSTLEIVNQMHEHINLKNYPLLSLLRHRHIEQPWSLSLLMNLIDARLITKGLSIFLRQAN